MINLSKYFKKDKKVDSSNQIKDLFKDRLSVDYELYLRLIRERRNRVDCFLEKYH